MTAREEKWNQTTAEVTGASRDEDNLRGHWVSLRSAERLGLVAQDSHSYQSGADPWLNPFWRSN
jgi:hypothetical protein